MLVVNLEGCAGKSANEDDDDSGGNAGTSASGGSGGSGGSLRPAKVGLNMMIRNPDPAVPETAGRTCPASSGVEWDIGAPIETNGMLVDVDSPSPTDFGSTLADGEGNTSITCTVTSGGTFQIAGGGTDPMITSPDGIINFTLSGTASLRGGANVTGLSVYTPRTLDLRTEAGLPPCTMTAVHQVQPSALWADFDCPALTKQTDPGVACHVNGTIVVEYCETQ